MCWLLLLLISQLAGIVWADRGGAWPTWIGVASSAAALGLGLGLALGERVGLGRPAMRRAGGIVALPVLGLAAASFGHAGLARELERARLGVVRAEAIGPSAIVLVDARVDARRSTRFGEEIELGAVRAKRGEAVPERLLLTLAPERGGSGGAASAPSGDGDATVGEGRMRSSRADRLLVPGAEVRMALRIRPLHPPRNPGATDRAQAWARRGISVRARLPKGDWVVERIAGTGLRLRVAAAASAFRRAAIEGLRRRLEPLGEGQGLVRALAVGDRRGISEATQDAFRRLGLTHLLSVSGLHIAFVAWPAAWIVHRLRLHRPLRRRRSAARIVLGFAAPLIAGSVAAGCYAWLTGAEVPALRACLLFALFAASRGLGWRIAPGPGLATIAVGLIATDPAVVFDLGAQLSFGACAALVVGGVWTRSSEADEAATASAAAAAATSRIALVPLARAASGMIVEAVRTSLVVSLGMLPLIELAGLPRALPSPVVNAIAIPWTGFVVMPCALGAALLAGVLPDSSEAPEAVLAALVAPAAGFERAMAKGAAALPEAWIDDERPGRLPWPIGIALIAFGLRRLRSGGLLGPMVGWMALAGLGLEPWPEASFGPTRPRLVFLDVGQADAALVQTRNASWLIDSGPGPEDGSGGAALVRTLRAEGVRRLDVLVLTHGDLDHRGGALRVLSAVEVDALWLPRLERPDPALERIAAVAEARGVKVRRVAAGERSESDDGLKVEVLWPPAPRPEAPPTLAPSGRARNERSLVLAVELPALRALFMADVGAEVERALVRSEGEALRSDLLKAGHHGSRQSSTSSFLAAVAPTFAIVSAPCLGLRGLPSGEGLQRLRDSGARLGWTGRDGALLVTARRAGSPTMRYWGEPRRCVPDFERVPPLGAGAGAG